MAEPRGEVTVRSFTGGAFAENTYLVACARTGEGILVDPGAAAADAIRAARSAGISIGQIVLTHAHVDHVEGIPLARRETGAPILLHPDDRPLWELTHGGDEEGAELWDVDLSDGQTLTIGGAAVTVIHTPGHAPGAVCLYVHDLGCVFTGDTLFQGGPGATGRSYSDADVIVDSIRRRLLELPDETVVHTGHGPDTTIAAEREGLAG